MSFVPYGLDSRIVWEVAPLENLFLSFTELGGNSAQHSKAFSKFFQFQLRKFSKNRLRPLKRTF